MKILIPLFILALLFIAPVAVERIVTAQTDNSLALPAEKHLRNIRQLTFGGENAEAYFSGNGRQLIFQSKRDGRACDQIYTMNADGSNVAMVSTGEGAQPAHTSFRQSDAFSIRQRIWVRRSVRHRR